MKKTLSLLLALIMVICLFSACSGEAQTSEETTAPEETTTSTPESDNSETSQPVNEAEWPRTITDTAGNQVTLESQPQNIALLHTFYLEHFLALGMPPASCAVGNALGQSAPLSDSEMFAPYLENVEITDLGSARDLSMEAILEAAPDLIVTFNAQGGVVSNYDELSAIATVIQLDYSLSWDNQLRECAQIVGKEAEAEEIIERINAKVENTKEVLSAYTDRTFCLFRTDGKDFMVRALSSYYDTYGITAPEGQPDSYDTLSLEAVAEMNPYYIVFQHNIEATQAFVESLESSSVWQSLDAVKNSRVYYFDENMNTFGPLATELTAEKLLEIYTAD